MPKSLPTSEKIRLLEAVLVKDLPIVQVCRQAKISRSTFYRWRKNYLKAKLKTKDRKALASCLKAKKPKRYPNQTSDQLEKKILKLAERHPEYSSKKISQILARVGNHGVQNVLNRHALNTIKKRRAFQIVRRKKEKVVRKAFGYIAMLAIPASFGLVATGKHFIKIFLGESYLPGVLPLYFLAFLIFPMIGVGTFLSLFLTNERPQIFAKLILITSILNIILNLVLIKTFLFVYPSRPIWATAGAGIATLVSWSFYFLASIYISKKQFNVSIDPNSVVKPLISSVVMFGILLFVLSYETRMSIFSILLVVLLGVLIYLVSMFLTKGIKSEDLSLIKFIINRKK